MRAEAMAPLLAAKQEEIDHLQEQLRQLREELAPSSVVIPREWKLTASQSRVFAHMTTRELVTHSSIMLALYSDRPADHPDPRIVPVFVAKIRRKLAPHGVRIDTVWGQGFSLVDRQKYVAKREAV